MPTGPNIAPTALLSFDVEEHFQIEAARGVVHPADWDRLPSRVERNVDWLLDQLAAHDASATFFVLGWVARRQPRMVRRIAAAGHELGCHGDAHDRLHRLDPRRLAADLAAARAAIEDQAQTPLRGYRAPTFSLTRRTAWAVDALLDAGFTYDSSLQPVRHPQYGEPAAPRRPHRLVSPTGAAIDELPPLCLQLASHRLPVAGGGYFRLFPLRFMQAGIAQAHRERRPAVLYFHPWEFDPDQPRLPLPRAQRCRTYVGLSHTRRRLQRILRRYRCTAIRTWRDQAQPPGSVDADPPTFRLAQAPGPPTDQPPAAFDLLRETGEYAGPQRAQAA